MAMPSGPFCFQYPPNIYRYSEQNFTVLHANSFCIINI